MKKLIIILAVSLVTAFAAKGQNAIPDNPTDQASIQVDNSLWSNSSLNSYRPPITFSDQINVLQVVEIEDKVPTCHCTFILDCTASNGTTKSDVITKDFGNACSTDLSCQFFCANLAFQANQQSIRCSYTCGMGCGGCY